MGSQFLGSWLKPLGINLIGCILVIFPISLTVLFAKHKKFRFATTFRRLFIVKIFSYGREEWPEKQCEGDIPLQSYLDDETAEVGPSHDNSIDKPVVKLTKRRIFLFVSLFAIEVTSLLAYGVFQERITITRYQVVEGNVTRHFYFHNSGFIMFTDRIVSSLLAVVILIGFKLSGRPQRLLMAPYAKYLYASLMILLNEWCQQEALKYVDFPTTIITKSMKILPVMLIGHFFMGFSYARTDYLIVFTVTLGTVMFMIDFGRHNQDHARRLIQHYSLYDGLSLMALFTIIHSIWNNYQGAIFKRYDASSWEAMAVQNMMIIVLSLTGLISNGQMISTVKDVISCSMLASEISYMAITAAVGQAAAYVTMAQFGPLVSIIFLTIRQVVAIFISSLLYGHSLAALSIVGIVIIFAAYALQVTHKFYQERKSSKT